ncbi:MAG: hypothetical protein IH865_13580 [Chloroflexi bacterium]|nr:hypothetical protein [Chloroflexota bacterium]
MNKKLMVYMDEDFHGALKELALRKKTTMAALVRYALDKTFEDDLDDIISMRVLEDTLAHPEESMSLEEYMEQRGFDVSNRANHPRKTGSRKVAEPRRRYGVRKTARPSR